MDAEESKRKVEEEQLKRLRARQAAQAETARLLLIAAERCAENGDASCPGSPAALATATAKALLAKAKDQGGGVYVGKKKKKDLGGGEEEDEQQAGVDERGKKMILMISQQEGGRGSRRQQRHQRRRIKTGRLSSPEGQEENVDTLHMHVDTCLYRFHRERERCYVDREIKTT